MKGVLPSEQSLTLSPEQLVYSYLKDAEISLCDAKEGFRIYRINGFPSKAGVFRRGEA